MQDPYIPPKDADFKAWVLNFAALTLATPALYGLTPADAAIIDSAASDFSSKYDLAVDPPTRTKPSVAAKDASRAATLDVVRPYSIQIRNNQGVSNQDKLDLGLNVPDFTPTPVPAPTTSPTINIVAATPLQHTFRFADSVTPTTRGKKPFGVLALQLYRSVTVAPAVDPDTADFVGNYTKNPAAVNYVAGDRGKYSTLFARWVTRSGPLGVAQVGPWSDPISMVIV